MLNSAIYDQLSSPQSRQQVILKYCAAKDVLHIGCVNHNLANTGKPGWLHDSIRSVASRLVGLDYLPEEVEQLRQRGYEVHCADITRTVKLDERFDVIVLGNLIEHLTNFEGLWQNINGLLNPNGVVLVSTANPFFSEQYFYSAFKNRIIINPEHTCWIDPVALDQLARRFRYQTTAVYWIAEKWKLHHIICNSEARHFDMLTGTWDFSTHCPGVFERLAARALKLAFALRDRKRYAAVVARYGERSLEALLYIKLQSSLFGIIWRAYSSLIVTSKLNEYELYMAVLQRHGSDSAPRQ